MRKNVVEFYNSIIKKTIYWLPVLICAFAAYGFDLFNRTVSTDGLWENYLQQRLQFRWGSTVWDCILGIYDISPFVDKYTALLFFVLFAISFCFLYYVISKSKNVIGYSLFSIVLITYPLINEIWNYTGANFHLTGGLLLCVWSIIVQKSNLGKLWRIVLAGLLMVLPVSSYEANVASYIVMVCIIIFYENVVVEYKSLKLNSWLNLMLQYALPVVIAIVLRFLVSGLLSLLLGIHFKPVGSTGLAWLDGSSLIGTVSSMINVNVFLYVIKALVYFPVAEFLICLVFFVGYVVGFSIKCQKIQPLLLGIVLFLSVFTLAILQGSALPYRTAQSVGLFVAFCVFIFFNLSRSCRPVIKSAIVIVLFTVCWHQSVYLHRVLALNNLRYENEAAMVHAVGGRIISEYDKKPVVFVSSYTPGEWIQKRISIDEDTWNGRLYNTICERTGISSGGDGYKKIFQTNINPFIKPDEVKTPGMLFSYLGYDLEIHTTPDVIKEATEVAKDVQLKPYSIYDNGEYLVVQLSGKDYYIDYLEDQ